MSSLKDIMGHRFSQLLVIGRAPDRGKKNVRWFCQCDCGNIVSVVGTSLRIGETKSCGCLRTKSHEPRHFVHGESAGGIRSKEYYTWASLRSRCLRRTDHGFRHYGGRGITVCDRWKDNFKNFLSDMGRAPSPQHSIDRIDNDGPYSPGNCRWTTAAVQSRNRSNNRFIEYGGEKLTVTDWSRRLGINLVTLFGKLNKQHLTLDQIIQQRQSV